MSFSSSFILEKGINVHWLSFLSSSYSLLTLFLLLQDDFYLDIWDDMVGFSILVSIYSTHMGRVFLYTEFTREIMFLNIEAHGKLCF